MLSVGPPRFADAYMRIAQYLGGRADVRYAAQVTPEGMRLLATGQSSAVANTVRDIIRSIEAQNSPLRPPTALLVRPVQ